MIRLANVRARRLRSERGLGLVELLIAMTVLNIGLLALIAALSSGMLALRRAGQTSTAATIADSQMELYRAIRYDKIFLDQTSTAATDSTYRNDQAILTGGGIGFLVRADCVGVPDYCNPSRTATGADGRSYRVDTYITPYTPPGGRQVKVVTVVVRDGQNVTGRPLARQVSSFDRSTG